MRLPRIRLRLRSLMLAVAIGALPLGLYATLESRRARFERLAAHHRSSIVGMVGLRAPDHVMLFTCLPDGRPVGEHQHALDRWHLDRSIAYRNAARRPWRAVAPAPPPPSAPSD